MISAQNEEGAGWAWWSNRAPASVTRLFVATKPGRIHVDESICSTTMFTLPPHAPSLWCQTMRHAVAASLLLAAAPACAREMMEAATAKKSLEKISQLKSMNMQVSCSVYRPGGGGGGGGGSNSFRRLLFFIQTLCSKLT